MTKLLEERRAQIQKKIGSELSPFLEGVKAIPPASREFSIFKESFLKFRNRYESKRKILESIMNVERLPSITDRVGELYMLFLYLGAVESIGNTVVDMLVMLLVAIGIDFHIECRHATPRIKHVSNIRELKEERIPLTTKLNFLRDNGLTELASIVDTQLRNDIAHLNFKVKGSEIFIRDKRAFEVLMMSLIDLWEGIEYASGYLHGSAEGMGIVTKQTYDRKISL